MKMMAYLLLGLLVVLSFFYLAGTTVSFHPLSIKFKSLFLSVGYLLFSLGGMLVMNSVYTNGREQGAKEFEKQLIEKLIEIRDSSNNNLDTIQNTENEIDKEHDKGHLPASF